MYGLYNVSKRLQLYYGKDVFLKIRASIAREPWFRSSSQRRRMYSVFWWKMK